MTDWKSALHPRRPGGHEGGGEFTRKPGGAVEAMPGLGALKEAFTGTRGDVNAVAHSAASAVSSQLGVPVNWNGKIKIMRKAKAPADLGEMDWDGTLRLRDDVAAELARTDGPVDPDAFDVVVHEMIHAAAPQLRPGLSDAAYQHPVQAAIEEGFTELGTIQHLDEITRAMGVADRPAKTGRTVGDWVARGQHGAGFGHYNDYVQAAAHWVTGIAELEGQGQRDARPGELADQINRVDVAGKPAVMAAQLRRALGHDDWDDAKLKLVTQVISAYFIHGDALQQARKVIA